MKPSFLLVNVIWERSILEILAWIQCIQCEDPLLPDTAAMLAVWPRMDLWWGTTSHLGSLGDHPCGHQGLGLCLLALFANRDRCAWGLQGPLLCGSCYGACVWCSGACNAGVMVSETCEHATCNLKTWEPNLEEKTKTWKEPEKTKTYLLKKNFGHLTYLEWPWQGQLEISYKPVRSPPTCAQWLPNTSV